MTSCNLTEKTDPKRRLHRAKNRNRGGRRTKPPNSHRLAIGAAAVSPTAKELWFCSTGQRSRRQLGLNTEHPWMASAWRAATRQGRHQLQNRQAWPPHPHPCPVKAAAGANRGYPHLWPDTPWFTVSNLFNYLDHTCLMQRKKKRIEQKTVRKIIYIPPPKKHCFIWSKAFGQLFLYYMCMEMHLFKNKTEASYPLQWLLLKTQKQKKTKTENNKC